MIHGKVAFGMNKMNLAIVALALISCSNGERTEKRPKRENDIQGVNHKEEKDYSIQSAASKLLSEIALYKFQKDMRAVQAFKYCEIEISNDSLNSLINAYANLLEEDACDLKLEMKLCNKEQIDQLIESIIIESETLYNSLLRLLPYGKTGEFPNQVRIDSIANREMEPEYGVADPCMINSWYALYKYRKIPIPDFIKIGKCEFVDTIITSGTEISEIDLLRFYYARCDSLGWN